MTKRVLKYPLEVVPNVPVAVRLAEGAEIIHVAGQRRQVCLWAIEAQTVKVERYFQIVGTGWDIDAPRADYVGTAHVGEYVWHVFEVNVPEEQS